MIRQAIVEALGRDPLRWRPRVAQVDGHASRLTILKNLALEFGVAVGFVMDILHVIEYLWKAAYNVGTHDRLRRKCPA